MSSVAAFRKTSEAAVAEKYAGLVAFAYDRSHAALVAELRQQVEQAAEEIAGHEQRAVVQQQQLEEEKKKLKRQETMYDSAEVVTFVSRYNDTCGPVATSGFKLSLSISI